MIFTETVLLSKETIKRFQGLLDGTIDWPDGSGDSDTGLIIDYVDLDIIHAVSVSFGDEWELDIDIAAGIPKPFVDAMLFHQGCEVYAWDITDSIVGEWQVVLGDDIQRAFKLEIRAEEEEE